MPGITRWFIKTSFIYLILALAIGIILAVQGVGKLTVPGANFFPTYVHILTEGWITMLIIGVAVWMFPKYSLEKPRGYEALGWISYVLLNIGLLLRIISEPFVGSNGQIANALAIMLILAAGLQWLGGMAFVINAWGRVKVK